MKRILFLSGTRADYGKLKSLMQATEIDPAFQLYIFLSGMHLLNKYGETYREIVKDNYKNIYMAYGLINSGTMSYDIGDVICQLTGYVKNIRPDMIVVHGDRIDALAGAIVGALNNILVAHIEGGELSGTIDESLRHAVSKLAHLHLVCNEEAEERLLQMGEEKRRIYVIGSPDIDVMLSGSLPSCEAAKAYYGIGFSSFAICMYHPVTTEYEDIAKNADCLVDALIESGKNYIVIFPNNDLGSDLIISAYSRVKGRRNFLVFPSLRFEYFLALLKCADFIIGNSSTGIREASVYGIPAIDIGSRQSKRYSVERMPNIQHVDNDKQEILKTIVNAGKHRVSSRNFGSGDSTSKFIKILHGEIWSLDLQKHFVDIDM